MPIASNTLAVYRFENNANDSSGNGYNLATVGSPNFTTPGCSGMALAGFSDGNYIVAPASLRTAFGSLTAWTIEFYITPLTNANNGVYFHATDSIAELWFQILSNGVGRFRRNPTNIDTAANTFLPGNTYHVAIVNSGGTITIYRATYSGGVLGAHSSVATSAAGGNTGTVSSLAIGRLTTASNVAAGGMVHDLRISNVARVAFPSAVDANTIGSYPLTSSLADNSGNGRDFTYATGLGALNFTSVPTSVAGTYRAGNFLAGNYFTWPVGLVNAFNATNTAWTIQGWTYLSMGPSLGVLWRAASPNPVYEISIQDSTAPLGAYVRWFTGGWNTIGVPDSLTANTWNHIAVTFNAGALKIYINGLLSMTYYGAPTPGTLTGGYIGSDTSSPWPGLLDEFRVSSAVLTAFPTLDTPDNLAAGTPTSTSVPLTWTDTPGASYYFIYRNTVDDSASATLVASVAQGVGAATIGGLNANTTYYFFVKAQTMYGTFASFTNSVSATTSANVANTPTGLAAGSPTSSTVPLTWTDAASPAAYYYVYRNTIDNSGSATLVGVAAQGVQTYTVAGLNASTQYYFWLKSLSTEGQLSAFTSSVNATTTSVSAPNAPINLEIDSVTYESISLAWQTGGGDFSFTKILRSDDNNVNNSVVVGAKESGVYEFTDRGLTAFTNYYYWIQTVNDAGATSTSTGPASGVTNPISPTGLLDDPAKIPQNLTATSTPSGILLNWDLVSGAYGYQIYRSYTYEQKLTPYTIVSGNSFLDSGVTLNNTFYYRITSIYVSNADTVSCEGGYGVCLYE